MRSATAFGWLVIATWELSSSIVCDPARLAIARSAANVRAGATSPVSAVIHALLVIMASAAIGWLLTFDQMPQHIAPWVQANVTTQWLVILMMNLMMLFLGMFIDLPAAVLLLTPVFLPMAHTIGMDPIQLGLMMVVIGIILSR